MGSHIFGFFKVRQFFIFTASKRTRMFVLQIKSKMFFIQSKKMGQFIKIESDQVGIAKITYLTKVTKMESIISHRIDYNGVGALRDQRHIPSKTYPKYPTPTGARNVLSKWGVARRDGCMRRFVS